MPWLRPVSKYMRAHQEDENSMFGKRDVYSNEWLIKLLEEKMDLVDTYAIRTFFGLSSNNDIKYMPFEE